MVRHIWQWQDTTALMTHHKHPCSCLSWTLFSCMTPYTILHVLYFPQLLCNFYFLLLCFQNSNFQMLKGDLTTFSGCFWNSHCSSVRFFAVLSSKCSLPWAAFFVSKSQLFLITFFPPSSVIIFYITDTVISSGICTLCSVSIHHFSVSLPVFLACPCLPSPSDPVSLLMSPLQLQQYWYTISSGLLLVLGQLTWLTFQEEQIDVSIALSYWMFFCLSARAASVLLFVRFSATCSYCVCLIWFNPSHSYLSMICT